MGPLPLSWTSLGVAAVLVVIGIAVVRAFRVNLSATIAWAAVRTVAQLLLVGYVLLWIFEAHEVWWVLLAFAVMLTVATTTAVKRVEQPIPGLLSLVGGSLFVGCGLTTFAVTAFVVRADPWWEPRYFLPLAGMIVGNSMNAAALGAERLRSELVSRRAEIEELLALGASPRQAAASSLRAALRAALIPMINAMMTVGLVSLPGMMTGQMIAGADPIVAARYQIVVMFMLSAATTVTAVMVGAMLYRRFFSSAWQLRLDGPPA